MSEKRLPGPLAVEERKMAEQVPDENSVNERVIEQSGARNEDIIVVETKPDSGVEEGGGGLWEQTTPTDSAASSP